MEPEFNEEFSGIPPLPAHAGVFIRQSWWSTRFGNLGRVFRAMQVGVLVEDLLGPRNGAYYAIVNSDHYERWRAAYNTVLYRQWEGRRAAQTRRALGGPPMNSKRR